MLMDSSLGHSMLDLLTRLDSSTLDPSAALLPRLLRTLGAEEGVVGGVDYPPLGETPL